MARYTGPMTKKSRRLGVDLVGGDQAYERRPYPPGQHGRGRIKESEYLLQLREKQKARISPTASSSASSTTTTSRHRVTGKTGDNLLQLLECRLDNVVYRAGFARTRRHASARRARSLQGERQEGRHPVLPGHRPRRDRRAREVARDDPVHRGSRDPRRARVVPAWLEALPTRMRILVHQLPVRAQIDIPVQEQLIVEYYSKK